MSLAARVLTLAVLPALAAQSSPDPAALRGTASGGGAATATVPVSSML